MKKISLLILTFVCFISMNAFADNCKTPCPAPNPCPKKVYTRPCPKDTFLCTNKEKDELLKCLGLSETQMCTTEKIQDKYELETLSINERIKCEEQNLNHLKKQCASKGDMRKVKNTIKELKKERKEICKCYEKQFLAILSDEQRKAYKNYKKN